MDPTKCAILLRVSDPNQHTENQLPELKGLAIRRGLDVAKVYELQESAWQGAHQKLLTEVYQDAKAGRFQVLLVWALDRLSREGPLATLQIIDRLGKAGVKVWSHQEPWTEVGGEMLELLLAIAGWVARMESNRRSERTKAGIARVRTERKEQGDVQTWGRPKGTKDKRKRSRRGYLLRYA